MRRFVNSSGFWAVLVLALLSGGALVAAAAWMRPLAEGERAIRDGRLDLALDRFAAAEARFDRLPVTKQVLKAEYAVSQANQLWLLYRLGRYDALIEKAAASPSRAPIHFWAGCALFAKAGSEGPPARTQGRAERGARPEVNKAGESRSESGEGGAPRLQWTAAEARLGWLERAGEEFRKALELDPDDWDTKFNYELTERLLAELRKQPKAPPPQLLQLLRPKPKEGQPPARRTG